MVEAVGSRVTAFNVGDAVFGTTTGLTVGANAEYVLVPQASQSSVLAHKPANMTNEQAVSLPIGSMTALYLLREAGEIGLGKQVLIYGASGSVGSYAVQIAKALGAEVTGVCSTRNLEMVKALGADYVIDYKMDDFSEQGKSYDVIFDAVGKTTANQRKRALKPDGAFTSIRANTHESPESLAFIAELVTN